MTELYLLLCGSEHTSNGLKVNSCWWRGVIDADNNNQMLYFIVDAIARGAHEVAE